MYSVRCLSGAACRRARSDVLYILSINSRSLNSMAHKVSACGQICAEVCEPLVGPALTKTSRMSRQGRDGPIRVKPNMGWRFPIVRPLDLNTIVAIRRVFHCIVMDECGTLLGGHLVPFPQAHGVTIVCFRIAPDLLDPIRHRTR